MNLVARSVHCITPCYVNYYYNDWIVAVTVWDVSQLLLCFWRITTSVLLLLLGIWFASVFSVLSIVHFHPTAPHPPVPFVHPPPDPPVPFSTPTRPDPPVPFSTPPPRPPSPLFHRHIINTNSRYETF